MNNKNLISCVIIDDDDFAIQQLTDALDKIHAPVEILGRAMNGIDGVDVITKKNPDLVFLDIEMPDMSGFQMLNRLNDITFKTIFTTSYAQYAIKAFRFNALDYLLKPIDINELKQAIARFKNRMLTEQNIDHIKGAIKNTSETTIENQKLVLHQHDQVSNPQLKEILFIEAQSNYSMLRLIKEKNILISKTLAYFENRLQDSGFYRCHKSFLVHGRHIQGFTKSSSIIMTNGIEVPVSRRKKTDLQAWYQKFISIP